MCSYLKGKNYHDQLHACSSHRVYRPHLYRMGGNCSEAWSALMGDRPQIPSVVHHQVPQVLQYKEPVYNTKYVPIVGTKFQTGKVLLLMYTDLRVSTRKKWWSMQHRQITRFTIQRPNFIKSSPIKSWSFRNNSSTDNLILLIKYIRI